MNLRLILDKCLTYQLRIQTVIKMRHKFNNVKETLNFIKIEFIIILFSRRTLQCLDHPDLSQSQIEIGPRESVRS